MEAAEEEGAVAAVGLLHLEKFHWEIGVVGRWAMLQAGRSQTVEAVPMEQAKTVSEYRPGQLQLLLPILLG